jgi:hypothetical protein
MEEEEEGKERGRISSFCFLNVYLPFHPFFVLCGVVHLLSLQRWQRHVTTITAKYGHHCEKNGKVSRTPLLPLSLSLFRSPETSLSSLCYSYTA